MLKCLLKQLKKSKFQWGQFLNFNCVSFWLQNSIFNFFWLWRAFKKSHGGQKMPKDTKLGTTGTEQDSQHGVRVPLGVHDQLGVGMQNILVEVKRSVILAQFLIWGSKIVQNINTYFMNGPKRETLWYSFWYRGYVSTKRLRIIGIEGTDLCILGYCYL